MIAFCFQNLQYECQMVLEWGYGLYQDITLVDG